MDTLDLPEAGHDDDFAPPVAAADVTIAPNGERASVASHFRGVLTAQIVDGTWLVLVPAFVD